MGQHHPCVLANCMICLKPVVGERLSSCNSSETETVAEARDRLIKGGRVRGMELLLERFKSLELGTHLRAGGAAGVGTATDNHMCVRTGSGLVSERQKTHSLFSY